jgi:inner membrane protein
MQQFGIKKAGILLAIVILLMIALEMTSGIVWERNHYQNQAKQSIANSWTGSQTLIGPMLVLPYTVNVKKTEWDDKNKVNLESVVSVHKVKLISPESLIIAGNADTQIRSLGIYGIPVYATHIDISGSFLPLELMQETERQSGFSGWQHPYLTVLINDIRGIISRPKLNWNDSVLSFQSGTQLPDSSIQGMHAELSPLNSSKSFAFSFSVDLRGMEQLTFSPLGMTTEVNLQSDWFHPGFVGNFLPESHRISDQGFAAKWRVSSFSSNIDRQLIECSLGQCGGLISNAFGVSMVQPINIYQQSDRATKYGILFISLTFIAFLVFEVTKKMSIHPVQYALVGLALAIFFLLLVALSEHIDFVCAYLSAASACTLLLSFYLGAILKSLTQSLVFTLMIAGLYVSLYVIISAEDTALLMGSGLIFVALSCLMVVTRRIDWYQLTAIKNNDANNPVSTES